MIRSRPQHETPVKDDYPELLPQVEALARRAGAAILELYARQENGAAPAVAYKTDASPVTAADHAAEALILHGLARLTPEIPVISEEAACAGRLPEPGARFWLVDPLDGTKEFIQRNGEFTVNIGLIEAGQPVLGVVLAPVLDRLYAGAVGLGAHLAAAGQIRPLRCRAVPAEGCTVVSSRSHGDDDALTAFLAGRRVARAISAGSSLKLCLLASGDADLYPRLGRTMEWDIAAGHAVLRAAGGHVRTLHGTELGYGKPGLANPHFVASGLD